MITKTKIVGFHSGHDVSYCILENGIPIIHEELERMTRVKMGEGDGLKLFFQRSNDTNIQYFAFGNYGEGSGGRFEGDFNDKISNDEMKNIIKKNHAKYYEFGHHLSHGANAFYTSDFDKALIIAVDGSGWEEGGILSALTIDEGIGNKINRIKIFDEEEVNIGKMYSIATEYIFGLSVREPKGSQEGTVMAMSTMGKPKYTDLFYHYRQRRLTAIADISEQEKFNVAASLQQYTEQTFYNCIEKYINESNHENICFSGGVSLNCVLLGKIKKWFPKIKNIFCDPIPYDAGLSLGAARYLWHHVLDNPRIKDDIRNKSPYLGKIYTKKGVEDAFNLFQNRVRLEKVYDEDVLNKICQQKVVAVFGGGSESGRRALGNRSILADPRNPQMKNIINENVKHRQWFRPLSPSILEEKTNEWFENPLPSLYMSFALKFKEDKKDKVPAVVHFDGTGRLQTVNKDLSPWFYGFLSKWEKLSGVPILLNTSFNDNEPIVETPFDALTCFLKTQIDYLYFFDFGLLIKKR